MAIRVKEIAFVFHQVSDIDASRRFYEQTLGLKAGMQIEFSPGTWWIEYDIAGMALAICNASFGEDGPAGPAASLALEVESLAEAKSTLTAAGAKIVKDTIEFPPCQMFVAADPSGNQITFHQRKAAG
ncbi:MAG TPA: VOC family protein [Opitutaceae bacterium]